MLGRRASFEHPANLTQSPRRVKLPKPAPPHAGAPSLTTCSRLPVPNGDQPRTLPPPPLPAPHWYWPCIAPRPAPHQLLALLLGQALQHLELDRQAVRVPAGYELGLAALQQLVPAGESTHEQTMNKSRAAGPLPLRFVGTQHTLASSLLIMNLGTTSWACVPSPCRTHLLMKSLRILLSAWPMWRSPLAYGGPSCRVYTS